MKRKRGSKKIKSSSATSPAHAPPSLAGDASEDEELETQADADSMDKSDSEDNDESGEFESSNEENSNTKGSSRPSNAVSSAFPDSIESNTNKKLQIPTPMAKPHLVFNRVKVKLKTSTIPVSSVTKSPCEGTGKASVVEGKQDVKPDEEVIAKSSTLTPFIKEASSQEDEKTQWKPTFDKHELVSALTVINKIMKMDAAEPFNVPVNPEALGIPDYFDVIDSPMDFGTISSNLEKGKKYKNSEDVYKDVQFIWDNCAKYNSKGAYVLDLMRRVKKNFMKYWTSAGLYTEPNLGSEDGAKPKKAKKRTGRRHKSDCLCAICVLKRRRREREESEKIVRGNVVVVDHEEKQESSVNGDSSSNLDESELDVEEKEDEAEKSMQKDGEEEEDTENEDLEENDRKINIDPEVQMGSFINDSEGVVLKKLAEVEQREIESNDPLSANRKELLRREERAKIYRYFEAENSKLKDICVTLFPLSRKSVWRGPHSLVPSQTASPIYGFDEALNSLIN